MKLSAYGFKNKKSGEVKCEYANSEKEARANLPGIPENWERYY